MFGLLFPVLGQLPVDEHVVELGFNLLQDVAVSALEHDFTPTTPTRFLRGAFRLALLVLKAGVGGRALPIGQQRRYGRKFVRHILMLRIRLLGEFSLRIKALVDFGVLVGGDFGFVGVEVELPLCRCGVFQQARIASARHCSRRADVFGPPSLVVIALQRRLARLGHAQVAAHNARQKNNGYDLAGRNFC